MWKFENLKIVRGFPGCYLAIVVLVCAQPKTYAQSHHYTDMDSIAVAKVTEIPEVKTLIASYENNTKHVSVLITSMPDANTRFYRIKVGIIDEIRFQTVYNFCVTPKNWTVKYLDAATDSLLSLNDWRARKKGKKVR